MQLWKECSAYLISLVFPSVCVHCRAPISKDVIANDQYSLAMASYLCKKCIIDFYPGQGIRCPRCGEALTEKNKRQHAMRVKSIQTRLTKFVLSDSTREHTSNSFICINFITSANWPNHFQFCLNKGWKTV
ncbi:MAG: Phosphoribosyltransferase [Candidatus Magnetoglobus multicellularis str. Araruama]|uniref:Phosphoribosyltransferase n=1 Tax=Candidatus Magnetoglobus multicellularis str. Araruama TaxID=890399 RepID=A0A1V1PAK9_9BACT|nr:MAG: Phosphoribosyltransferase [Candidatus Magnetoglobus multicellularis str. Araruama]